MSAPSPVLYKVNACQFDYEYMGRSVDELARIYGFPVALIEGEIRAAGWVRKIEPTTLPDTKDILAFAEALKSSTETKLSIIALFRQIENQPIIAQIEKAALERIQLLIMTLAPEDDRAASKLKALIEAANLIQSRDPIAIAAETKKAIEKNPGLTVQIANFIQ